MTSITVTGALFFLLAAPEKVSPHCYERDGAIKRWFCTASTVCFWTYPVVCCLFVVLVYAKNLVDQRMYYEFLLHKVVIAYGRTPVYKAPIVLMLLLYALCAFSALIWYHISKKGEVMVDHIYSSLAYITPIISFLSVLLTQWAIQGKLVTLPNFLDDYDWAVQHLNQSRCYYVDFVHAGFNEFERELRKTSVTLDTPQTIALVEYYTKQVKAGIDADIVEQEARAAEEGDPDASSSSETPKTAEKVSEAESLADKMKAKLESGLEKGVGAAKKALSKEGADLAKRTVLQGLDKGREWVYWQVRLLFNPRLQDARSQSFRNWALAYMVTVILVIIISIYFYVACLVTCLEIEHVMYPGVPGYSVLHHFSLRPDLGATAAAKSLKQVAANAAISVINHSTKAFFKASGGLTHFQLGAAAL